jgi:hypothetical protein
MPQFIAIPVAQGDAFYLEREGFSLLVDGGRSRSALPSMFQVATKTDGVNVIVCTHNDADHANGILGFLEAGLKCEELWLPGRWLGALPDVLRPFSEVFRDLVDNVNNIAEKDIPSNVETPQQSPSLIEAYGERVHDRLTEDPATAEGPSIAENGWPESYLQMLEQAEPWDLLPYLPGLWDPENWLLALRLYQQLEPARVQLVWSAIDAADRIRAIAAAAFHRGLPVQWFEFDITTLPDLHLRGGVPELRPVNGREVASVRPRVGSLLDWLPLTVSNKESLVLWSPATAHHPGVLFTADSDLAGVGLPSQLDGAIATAPHHGSEANANAYRAVAAASNARSITWVRSDGRYRSRPGSTYLGLASRLCTICRRARGNPTMKQVVRLYSSGGAWIRHRETRVCSCQ